MGARNRVGIGLSYRTARLNRLAGGYEKSILTRFPAHIDYFKITAQKSRRGIFEELSQHGERAELAENLSALPFKVNLSIDITFSEIYQYAGQYVYIRFSRIVR
jgi:hypothetical protein